MACDAPIWNPETTEPLVGDLASVEDKPEEPPLGTGETKAEADSEMLLAAEMTARMGSLLAEWTRPAPRATPIPRAPGGAEGACAGRADHPAAALLAVALRARAPRLDPTALHAARAQPSLCDLPGAQHGARLRFIAKYAGEVLGLAATLSVGTSFEQFARGEVDVGFI